MDSTYKTAVAGVKEPFKAITRITIGSSHNHDERIMDNPLVRKDDSHVASREGTIDVDVFLPQGSPSAGGIEQPSLGKEARNVSTVLGPSRCVLPHLVFEPRITERHLKSGPVLDYAGRVTRLLECDISTISPLLHTSGGFPLGPGDASPAMVLDIVKRGAYLKDNATSDMLRAIFVGLEKNEYTRFSERLCAFASHMHEKDELLQGAIKGKLHVGIWRCLFDICCTNVAFTPHTIGVMMGFLQNVSKAGKEGRCITCIRQTFDLPLVSVWVKEQTYAVYGTQHNQRKTFGELKGIIHSMVVCDVPVYIPYECPKNLTEKCKLGYFATLAKYLNVWEGGDRKERKDQRYSVYRYFEDQFRMYGSKFTFEQLRNFCFSAMLSRQRNEEFCPAFFENGTFFGNIERSLINHNELYCRSVHVILVDEITKRLCLTTRALTKASCPGYLDFSAGGMISDQDEGDFEALCRETDEELGISLDYRKVLKTVHFKPDPKNSFWSFGTVMIHAWNESLPTVKPEEFETIAWYTFDQCIKLVETIPTKADLKGFILSESRSPTHEWT
jgi:8-oxo-dGTP pyrophosphatase MutT (NUDIX family)